MGGVPSALLAARRAANQGHDVVLATSDRGVDDDLAELANAAGVAVHRGPGEDVQARLLQVCEPMADNDILVRMTADNLVPDGDVVTRVVSELVEGGAALVSAHTLGLLPVGVSAEAMRVGSLRTSRMRRDDRVTREHVTSELYEHVEASGRASPWSTLGDVRHLRCTIDSLEDYRTVRRVFAGVRDPFSVPWDELVARLRELPGAPRRFSPGPGFALGTAQLADAYGSLQSTTPPSEAEATMIVRRAVEHRAVIDTARAYPGSEARLGRSLASGWASRTLVTTKLPPIEVPEASTDAVQAADAAELHVLRSRLALAGVVPALLLHRPCHRTRWGGAVWTRLRELRDAGELARLGVSVNRPSEAAECLVDPEVSQLQFPLNVLDWRWEEEAGEHLAAAMQRGVELHARSAFLQGILLRGKSGWPQLGGGYDTDELRQRLDRVTATLERESVADLCIAWARGVGLRRGWPSRIVIGVERLDQLEVNLQLFAKPALDAEALALVRRELGRPPVELVTPSSWERPRGH